LMRRNSTITATDMRRINRSVILDIVRRESPISRTLIAEKLGVSLPTVMRIVDELVEEGLVRSSGSTEWSGGRRRPLLEFNAEGFVVIGVDLGAPDIYAAVADLGGNILEVRLVNRRGISGDESYERLAGMIETLLSSAIWEGRRMMGIGVGAPGITLPAEGVVTWAPSLNWREYPLKQKLTDRFHLPVLVENDVNLAALGELWFGAGQSIRNMVLIAITNGIGAGIIVDGMLHRGAHYAAGEVGYLLPGREFLRRQYSEFGALEEVASGTGIIARARQVLLDQREPEALASLTAEDVFEAARRGEGWASTIMDDVLDYLAIMVSSVSAYFDPELIVMESGVTKATDWLAASILQRIEGTTPVEARVEASLLGPRATVLGAVIAVLEYVADANVVHKLV
jgi:glucokinase